MQILQKQPKRQRKLFAGQELKGKKLGVIGLGAIGQLVANAAIALGMDVYGYDRIFQSMPLGIFQARLHILSM